MHNYSQRELTYGKDKLIALSGLAHDYFERGRQSEETSHTHDRGKQRGKYAAGLWEADMPSALLWRTHQFPPDMTQPVNASPLHPPWRPSEYRAPSWAWASVDAHISYDSQMLDGEAKYGGIWLPEDPPSPRAPSEYDFGAFRIQEMETTTSASDPMGAVSAGHMYVYFGVHIFLFSYRCLESRETCLGECLLLLNMLSKGHHTSLN